jgi:ribonuclease HI
MRILQHNCRKTYAITIAALEAGLQLGVGLVCLQEPYIGNEFRHGGYQIYWPEAGAQENRRVAVAIRRDIFNQAVVEARTDLIDHPYIMAVDIWELGRAKEKKRRTRVINCYDNWLGPGLCWQGDIEERRRAIEDVHWDSVLEGRCLLLGDFNAHSPLWNPQANGRTNAVPLENLIESESLYINNKLGIPTRPKTTPGISIIDLSLTTVDMGPLLAWTVDEDHATGSDHELLVMEWAPIEHGWEPPSDGVTGWQIQALQADSQALEYAKRMWQANAERRGLLDDACSVTEVEGEAVWIQETLTAVLDQYAKPVRVTPRSKRWWNRDVKWAREAYCQARRAWQGQHITTTDLREARNDYYRTIRRAKRTCWESFLAGPTDIPDHSREETARCWVALRLTKSRTTAVTPTLKGPQGEIAVSISEKEALVRKVAFPPAPGDREAIEVPPGTWHKCIDEATVKRALFHQAVQKAPGIDRLNFRALRLVWEWDSSRIVALARQCFRLGIHPQAWKTAKGVLLRKLDKPDHTLVKAYRVISLLNCLGKVVEKVAAEAIADHCETTGSLHPGQMGGRKQRSAVDAVACLIQNTHDAWKRKQLMAALFMDVAGAFDHVNDRRLVMRMQELGFDGDLIRWVQSFLSGRLVQLVIDNTQCPAHRIDSGVPQGSPVSPILFLIYLSGIFDAIERAVPGVQLLSFADDMGFLAPGYSVQEACQKLQEAAQVAIEWGESNLVQFEAKKTEAVLFTRKRGQELRNQIQRARIMVGGHSVSFNSEATRWLGIWLDAGLTLKVHYQTRLRKARNAESRVRSLCRMQGLAPGLVHRIQVAAVQSVALYGAELWWRGQKDQLTGMQRMINRQARAITGMLKTTPIGLLNREAGLTPAEVLLEGRQLRYTARLLGLPEDSPARSILPVSFREGDQHAQPGEHTPGNRLWAEPHSRGPWSLGQHLARQLASILPADPSAGFESARRGDSGAFPGRIIVQRTEDALIAARAMQPGNAIWSDGSRLENGRSGAGIAWQEPCGEWKARSFPLGKGREVFDAELVGAVQALQAALKMDDSGPITVLLDSQAAIARLRHTQAGPGQELTLRAHAVARALQERGREPVIQWVPGHAGIEGNEKADEAAKLAASRPGCHPEAVAGLSLAFINRTCTENIQNHKQAWLAQECAKRSRYKQRTYRPYRGWALDPVASRALKPLATRFFQLKSGHAAIGAHLHRIHAREGPACERGDTPTETVHHVLFECRAWQHQRAQLYRALDRAGVARPSAAEDCPEGRLLGEPKATAAILQFLSTTKVALPRHHHQALAERARRDDEWGLEDLEEAERTGEG